MFKNVTVEIEQAEKYHARQELSTSKVKDWADGPEVFHWYHVRGEKKKATDAMDFGTAVHEDQLLPIWQRRYTIIPPSALTSNGARRGTAWERFKAEHQGEVLLKEDAAKAIEDIRASLAAHPGIAEVLGHINGESLTEVSLIGELQVVGFDAAVPYRGRVDVLLLGQNARIIDFKTTSDMSPRAMQYKPYDAGWDLQAAAYQGLVYALRGEVLPVDFVVMESTAPFRAEIYTPRQATIGDAFDRLIGYVADIQRAYASGDWHRTGWPGRIQF